MPPRSFTLPSARTDSAKAARSAFYCDLCSKGYSRMNEYEAHESSYDHQHKKRLKEMKEMQRQVQAGASAGKKEEKGALMSIKLGGSAVSSSSAATTGTGGGFKKGGFRNAFAPVGVKQEDDKKEEEENDSTFVKTMGQSEKYDELDSDLTDEEDYYDPRRPTGCMAGCPGRTITG